LVTRGGRFFLTVRCENPKCKTTLDLPLDLKDFTRTEDPRETNAVTEDGRTLKLRVPTGDDQRQWLSAFAGADAPDTRAIARALVAAVDDEPPGTIWRDSWLPAVERALEEADPLTNLEVQTTCPECGASLAVALDLEAELLRLLALEQPRLLDEVHRLAAAYHWSEAEILSLPGARRREYLRRIEEAGLA
jgi:hypothetical protein